MKIHITNLYGMNSRGTQIISQRSVVKVAKELGFCMYIGYKVTQKVS